MKEERNTLGALLFIIFIILAFAVPVWCSVSESPENKEKTSVDVPAVPKHIITTEEKAQASGIENATARALEDGKFGWCDTPYGRIYIMQDGALVKGIASIADEYYCGPLINGAYRKKTGSDTYYFDKLTGLMKKNEYVNMCYFGKDGKLWKLSPAFLFIIAALYLMDFGFFNVIAKKHGIESVLFTYFLPFFTGLCIIGITLAIQDICIYSL